MGVRITENFIRETEALRKCLLYKDVTWEITKKDDYNDWGDKTHPENSFDLHLKEVDQAESNCFDMPNGFGKKDVIFIGALLGICLIVLGVWYFAGGKQGALVVVTREGEVYGTYSLSQPQTVKIKNSKGKTTNVLVIRDGKADMKEADCPDKLCVHQKAISAENESIVCLPNRVVVTVTNSKKEGMDGFAQ